VDWPDCSLPGGWHLNSRRVPVPPVPRFGPDVTTQDFINFWGKFFVFVLLEMIEISQGFKTFESN
jgi:hypothetical protein